MNPQIRNRILATLLTVGAAGFATWKNEEGFTDHAIIPTKGDVPTIGHGSTRYENGDKVKMGDKITPQRANILARNLLTQDEKRFSATIPGVSLHQEEFEVYVDFIGQFGIGNWTASTARKQLIAGNYTEACKALLRYKFSAGYDCSTPGNKVCYGVWERQQRRVSKCLAAQ